MWHRQDLFPQSVNDDGEKFGNSCFILLASVISALPILFTPHNNPSGISTVFSVSTLHEETECRESKYFSHDCKITG